MPKEEMLSLTPREIAAMLAAVEDRKKEERERIAFDRAAFFNAHRFQRGGSDYHWKPADFGGIDPFQEPINAKAKAFAEKLRQARARRLAKDEADKAARRRGEAVAPAWKRQSDKRKKARR